LSIEKTAGIVLKCKVCNRVTDGKDFCALHLKAHKNVTENYEAWKKALGLSWIEYLHEIRKNSLTGEWAKEVAKYLIEDEGTRDVKES
jgi:thymidine phosphorylase